MDDDDADAAVDGARRGAAAFDPSLSTATIGDGGGGIDAAADDDDDAAAAAAAAALFFFSKSFWLYHSQGDATTLQREVESHQLRVKRFVKQLGRFHDL